jgi:hypothetical protein
MAGMPANGLAAGLAPYGFKALGVCETGSSGVAGVKALRGLDGAGADGAAGAAVLFFAMSAKAFKMLEVSGAAAGCCGIPRGFAFGAGDPSGVFDSTFWAAFNLSLNDASIGAGNVAPRSQMSTNFLILS